MGNTNSNQQPRMTITAKGRGPIPPQFLNLQNSLAAGVPTQTVVSTTVPPPLMASYPVAAPVVPAVAAPTATTVTTDTVISGPMLPPRLPPVPVIDHPIQPGIYQTGPSVVETYTITQPPYAVSPRLEEAALITASAPPQPSPMMQMSSSPQPSPPATFQQQQFLQPPPLPVGYNQMDAYQGAGAYYGAAGYGSDNEVDEDDTASYTSFEEEVYVVPPNRRELPTYSRRSSPNFLPTPVRDSPLPSARRSPMPTPRDSPPPSGIPLSARSRVSAYSYTESPYDRYTRSRAFERYQSRVNSRMSSFDQQPDRYGFYPNAYRI